MTAFKFEFKDQMLNLKTKPQPRYDQPGGTCGGCVFFQLPDWCRATDIKLSAQQDCIGKQLVFVAADKATEEKLTVIKIAERLKE